MTDNLTFDPARKVQLTDRISFCSACFNQQPDKAHVDFNSSFDGPVMSTGPAENPINVSIDELVLCEDCLKAGADVLGLVDPTETDEALQEATNRIEELSERLAGAVAFIDQRDKLDAKRATLTQELKG